MPPHRFTIRQAARLLDTGLVTSEQLAAYCHSLAVAGEQVWGLNAFASLVAREELLDQARASDDKRKYGEAASIFEGLPISVKANLAVATEPLTAGSRILGAGQKDTPPCGYDADTVRVLLRDSGALLVGTTNMDEFGMGSLGTNVVSSNSQNAYTINPVQYLRRLDMRVSSSSSMSEDESVAEIIRTPADAILEAHSKAFDAQEELFSAGGSSCGSAASVAHGSSLLSLGTDTGGSVRLPAAWCGVVGLKPSYGLLSRHGVVSYASSFDTVGILAPSVECAAIALDKLAQRSGISRDSTSSFYEDSNYASVHLDTQSLTEKSNMLQGIKVGIPSSFSVEECPPEIKEAWSRGAERLQKHGASIETISTDQISTELVQKALAAYYVLVSAEASSNLSRYDGFRYGVGLDLETAARLGDLDSDLTPLERQYSATRMQGFGTEVTRRILCGTSVLSSDKFHTQYEAAAKLRAVLSQQLRSALENVDLLLIPTALSPPCSLDRDRLDSTEMFANDVMTVPASLAGLPSVSIPVSLTGDGKHMAGLQLMGARLREDMILRAGQILEQADF
jgi:aspartyl-tRNA(Asn)/glutamyl-tRNA(Gln) amidotransferase subunit A